MEYRLATLSTAYRTTDHAQCSRAMLYFIAIRRHLNSQKMTPVYFLYHYCMLDGEVCFSEKFLDCSAPALLDILHLFYKNKNGLLLPLQKKLMQRNIKSLLTKKKKYESGSPVHQFSPVIV